MGALRLILALAVVLTHSGSLWGYQITGGSVAVQCFFIISGFYMALILNEKYVAPGDLRIFYVNRLARIFSLYWLFLALALAAALQRRSCCVMPAPSSTGRPVLATVEPNPIRPCSATEARPLVRPNST